MGEKAFRAYHEHLLGRMADILGLDLDLELDASRISRAMLERAIGRCADCPDPEGCELWLATHAGGSDTTPELCRNKRFLEHLRGKS